MQSTLFEGSFEDLKYYDYCFPHLQVAVAIMEGDLQVYELPMQFTTTLVGS